MSHPVQGFEYVGSQRHETKSRGDPSDKRFAIIPTAYSPLPVMFNTFNLLYG
jgi:hypothetical protein